MNASTAPAPRRSYRISDGQATAVLASDTITIPTSAPSGYARMAALLADATQSVEV